MPFRRHADSRPLQAPARHGRTGLTRLVMGSVAEEVLRRAPCPVLTIRATADVMMEEEIPELLSI